MRRLVGLRSKIFLAGDNAAAEELRPGPIDLHAGGQWIGPIDEPLGQAEAGAWRAIGQWRQSARRTRLDRLARREEIAAIENGRHPRLALGHYERLDRGQR